MAGTVVDPVKLDGLNNVISVFLTGGFAFLFVDDIPVVHDSVKGDFTEAAWGGYAQAALTGWTSPALTGDFHYSTSADPITFTNTSGSDQTYRGWGYVDSGGNLIIAENLGADIPILDGETKTFNPTFTDNSEV